MKKILMKHQLLRTLIELRGNPRACVLTEPMWGLSMNLCLPYATVYMLTFGMNDVQVGIVTSIYMFSQMICAFLSGAIVDKMGRRKSTAIFDFLAWSVPCLIWAFSQGFWFFVVAALLNGMMKITTVSWDCLLVEDAPKDKITHIYSWIIISGNLSALFAPISSILVSKLTLAPAIRILYINAFIVMTAKLLILYKFSTETGVGKIRREESRNMSWGEMLAGYKSALRKIINSRGTIFAIIISILVEIVGMLGMTFWQIIASRRIGIPDTLLPIFPMARSILAILLFFTVVSRIRQTRLKWPLYGGFISSIIGCILLISISDAGVWGYVILSVSLVFEALGGAVLNTLRESLVAIHVDPVERSGIMALLQTTVMLVSVPFGYIGGLLSDISRVLPFVLSIALLLLGILATTLFYRRTSGT
ncbi:MFS transporter [Clostridium thermosuccinogenes]|jgi:MFS family permease|uniref:MFS transporter n=1 Tax=Clostridium thermosuccinogenes TaxID=84032 RepID=A0A2K2F0E7_9CLOT|nr:MFS transporter [Pseudoclostridium thermosuccinogenes]AUS97074.1 MFS transporter [Pseudoclostridium thermosuccinogenes]PNT92261.1 MFS transporter [Pseudoclostridium thermosuccinogenes]PNT96684.1 MFS transporter [Pseudoclostridium thermosuccinogenes]PNT98478.1 MFS transporter [Pseudoclostridium thermosuccinogenes]